MLRHFRGSIIFTVVCMVLALVYGWSGGAGLAGALRVMWIVSVLAVLEVSLSFDNAVVNATVLEDMDEVWRQRFLTWGMVFAVYGMYIFFPLAIVAVAAGLGPVETIRLSISNPEQYETIVSSAHTGIAGFGGAFLTMVGLKFFFDAEKEVHWIGVVERFLARFSALPAVEIAVLLLGLWGISSLLPLAEAHTFLTAGLLGIVAFIAVDALGAALEQREDRMRAMGAVVRSGLGGFIYLNVLDASFSFDAVIGAFALSNNMVVIALGLSIGAMFVRSLTLLLVRKGTLSEYRYLEHGAFWAIISLGAIMLVSARYEVPESVTGLIGAVLIAASLYWSVRHNRRNEEAEIVSALRD
ncbi:MAG: hypothetical protein RLZZ08_1547 [Pseudomonadota bacterium]|jgi:hypothetical protein